MTFKTTGVYYEPVLCETCTLKDTESCRHTNTGYQFVEKSDEMISRETFYCPYYTNTDGFKFYELNRIDGNMVLAKEDEPETKAPAKFSRRSILEGAIKNVCGDRDIQYGSPEDSFKEIARLWSVYLDKEISAHDAGVMMALFKIARIKTGYGKEDNYIDCAGYIACAAECANQSK